MDPPDGGSITVLEQLRRMADNAAKYRAALATDTAKGETKPEYVGARYIVIGYGESDKPMAELVPTQDGLLNAVLGMMYTRATDADDEIRESYRRDLNDEDEWHGGIWSAEFEIGGIVVYDVGLATTAVTDAALAAAQPTRGGDHV